jgi:SET domain-containing protein
MMLINPKSKRKLLKFINHNYKNNCYFVTDEENRRVKVYSLVDIYPSDELFISYGDDYWNL